MRRITYALCASTCALVLLLGVPPTARALTASPVTSLPSSASYKEEIGSDGRTIVYKVTASWGEGAGKIVAYDIATGTERVLTDNGRYPDVSGDTVVYGRMTTEAGVTHGTVVAYDLKTSAERVVASAQGTELYEPKIDGSTVVYSDGSLAIWALNIETGETTTLTANGYGADVSGDWVVYCEFGSQVLLPYGDLAWQGDIMAYNTVTKQTYALCDNDHDQRNPRIGSTGVVTWDDERNAPSRRQEFDREQTDVYGCSVYDRTNFAVARGEGVQSGSSVYGNLVVYADYTMPSGYNILGRDLLSQTRFGIAPENTGLSGVAISGGLLVYGVEREVVENTWVTDLCAVSPAILEVTEDSDAYRDSVAVSQEAFPVGCDAVAIASPSSWTADLAAASFVETGQPLLLTRSDSLPDVVAAELRRLGATSATIIGGASVSPEVEAAIRAILEENRSAKPVALAACVAFAPTIERISGDRYALTNSVAKRVASRRGWNGTVLIASGSIASQAMPVVSLTASRGLPVLLASPQGLSKAQLRLLRSIGAKRAVIVGRSTAVPARVTSQLRSVLGTSKVRRLSGDDLYATAALAAEYGAQSLGLRWNGVQLASTKSFTNVVTGGLRNARRGSVLLLTNASSLSGSASYRLKLHRKAARRGSYLGGTSVLGRGVRAQVRAILH